MKILQKRFVIPLIIAIVVLLVGGWLLLRFFNPSIFPSHPIDRLNNSTPKDIVFIINEYVYKTSEPIDQYANIRWAESGTYRNQDVPAFGIYISSNKDSLYPQYTETKRILEKNGFSKNEANTFGKFETPNESNGNLSREDTGYQNDKTICSISISASENRNISSVIYHLALKCGALTSTFISEDWKIYKNNEYGIRLKYPPTLTVSQNQKDVITFHNLEGIGSKGSGIAFSITNVNVNLLDLNAEDKGEVTIGGYKARKYIRSGYPTTTAVESMIYIIPEKNMSILYYLGNADSHKVREFDMNAILSTFEFTGKYFGELPEKWMDYKEGKLSKDKMISQEDKDQYGAIYYYGNVDTSKLKGGPCTGCASSPSYVCTDTNKLAEKIKIYEPPKGIIGGANRYAIICDKDFWIWNQVEINNFIYGPFSR